MSRVGLPEGYESLAGMSDEAVTEATGMDWASWADLLDDAGASSWPHKEIAAWIREQRPEVSGWWAQSVTVAYERFRGLRDVGQRRDGGYEVNKSRTMAVGVEALWKALTDEERRRRWLDREVAIRTETHPRSIRMTLSDETALDAYLTVKGPRKTTISLQHRRLPDRATAEEHKVYWGERLDALARVVASDPADTAGSTDPAPRSR